jgi:hypothetical protein
MTKPRIGLRKPPAPVDDAAAKQFVRGSPERPEPVGSPALRRSKAVVERSDGRQLRRTTVYLPPELHRRVAVHAASFDIDVSGVVVEALEQFLRP